MAKKPFAAPTSGIDRSSVLALRLRVPMSNVTWKRIVAFCALMPAILLAGQLVSLFLYYPSRIDHRPIFADLAVIAVANYVGVSLLYYLALSDKATSDAQTKSHQSCSAEDSEPEDGVL